MKNKFTSRKFWLSTAAFFESVAVIIAGFQTGNPTVAAAGAICGALSAAIYSAAESHVDANRE